MASAGPNSPGTLASNAANGGANAWASPSSAASSNDVRAVADLTSAGGNYTSEYLKATNFGFAIPAGATIDGVVVEVERSCASTAGNPRDLEVNLVKTGTATGNNKASAAIWPTTDAYATYGTSSDLWGVALSASDVNASNFGVVVSARGDIGGGKWSTQARIDHVRITVYYTAGVSGLPPQSVIHSQSVRRAANY